MTGQSGLGLSRSILRSVKSLGSLPNPHSVPSRGMVGQSGLEPPTSRLSVVCSNQLSYWPASSQAPPSGGDKRVRTADLLLAKQALSQLSYTPASVPSKLNNDTPFLLPCL